MGSFGGGEAPTTSALCPAGQIEYTYGTAGAFADEWLGCVVDVLRLPASGRAALTLRQTAASQFLRSRQEAPVSKRPVVQVRRTKEGADRLLHESHVHHGRAYLYLGQLDLPHQNMLLSMP
jgi:hypothetical protein